MNNKKDISYFLKQQQYFEEFLKVDYVLENFTSDGAEQIKNALGEVHDLEDVLYKNDLWHVEKNVKSNWNKDELTMEQKKELIGDIKLMAALDNEADFCLAEDLWKKKWRSIASEFVKYFQREYLDG